MFFFVARLPSSSSPRRCQTARHVWCAFLFRNIWHTYRRTRSLGGGCCCCCLVGFRFSQTLLSSGVRRSKKKRLCSLSMVRILFQLCWMRRQRTFSTVWPMSRITSRLPSLRSRRQRCQVACAAWNRCGSSGKALLMVQAPAFAALTSTLRTDQTSNLTGY